MDYQEIQREVLIAGSIIPAILDEVGCKVLEKKMVRSLNSTDPIDRSGLDVDLLVTLSGTRSGGA